MGRCCIWLNLIDDRSIAKILLPSGDSNVQLATITSWKIVVFECRQVAPPQSGKNKHCYEEPAKPEHDTAESNDDYYDDCRGDKLADPSKSKPSRSFVHGLSTAGPAGWLSRLAVSSPHPVDSMTDWLCDTWRRASESEKRERRTGSLQRLSGRLIVSAQERDNLACFLERGTGFAKGHWPIHPIDLAHCKRLPLVTMSEIAAFMWKLV